MRRFHRRFYSYLLLVFALALVFTSFYTSDTSTIAAQEGGTATPKPPRPTRTPRPPRLSQATLGKLCASGTGIPSAPAFAPAPGLHLGIILKETGGIHPFNRDKALKDLVSTAPQLAFCLGAPIRRQANNCYYLRKEASGFVVPVFPYDGSTPNNRQLGEVEVITVRVLAVQTGQLVDTFEIEGAYSSLDPNFCAGKNGKPAQSDPVIAAQFANRIKTIVMRQ